jgi:hypothetical protein
MSSNRMFQFIFVCCIAYDVPPRLVTSDTFINPNLVRDLPNVAFLIIICHAVYLLPIPRIIGHRRYHHSVYTLRLTV